MNEKIWIAIIGAISSIIVTYLKGRHDGSCKYKDNCMIEEQKHDKKRWKKRGK